MKTVTSGNIWARCVRPKGAKAPGLLAVLVALPPTIHVAVGEAVPRRGFSSFGPEQTAADVAAWTGDR
jgi:hypothetical protein